MEKRLNNVERHTPQKTPQESDLQTPAHTPVTEDPGRADTQRNEREQSPMDEGTNLTQTIIPTICPDPPSGESCQVCDGNRRNDHDYKYKSK